MDKDAEVDASLEKRVLKFTQATGCHWHLHMVPWHPHPLALLRSLGALPQGVPEVSRLEAVQFG